MVRDERTFLGARSGGADRHPAVNLSGVGADDLRLESLRKLQRERALAGRGLPGQDHDGRGHSQLYTILGMADPHQ